MWQSLGTAWQRAGIIGAAASSPDGHYLATDDSLGSLQIRIWTITSGDLRKQVCTAIGRTLSKSEWRQYVGTQIPYRNVCAGVS